MNSIWFDYYLMVWLLPVVYVIIMAHHGRFTLISKQCRLFLNPKFDYKKIIPNPMHTVCIKGSRLRRFAVCAKKIAAPFLPSPTCLLLVSRHRRASAVQGEKTEPWFEIFMTCKSWSYSRLLSSKFTCESCSKHVGWMTILMKTLPC